MAGGADACVCVCVLVCVRNFRFALFSCHHMG